jgi:hypothetical protein
MRKPVADKTETAVDISQRGFGLLGLGLVTSLFMGSSQATELTR